MRLVLAAAAAVLTCSAASAQVPCGSYDQIVKSISAAKYGERRIATGETSIGGEGQNVGVEIYAAPLGKTFTVLLVRPDGLACIISAGSNLRTFPLPEPGTEL